MDPLLGAAGAVTTVVGAVLAATQARRWVRAKREQTAAALERAALLRAVRLLGHDPSQVLVQVVREPARRGVQLYTLDKRPLRFYTLREIGKAAKRSGANRRRWRRQRGS